MRGKTRAGRPRNVDASPIQEARNIPEPVKLRLVASSAGRCEFRGCNRDLYQHPVTSTPGNYAQAAHIVAFREAGPRGATSRPEDVNAFENLMLLCGDCHHLIDTKHAEFSVELLKEHKREHEDRIFALTALGPEYRTTVIQLRATIGGQPVDIPGTDIRAALNPRYPARLPGVLIDLTAISRESTSFFELAREQIRSELRPALRAELEAKRVQHYSVLALAPIPVLACLGRELGNKVAVDLYQRHRDQTWRWREDGPVVDYEFRRLRAGSDPLRVALVLSLSARVGAASLPADVDGSFTVYEITLRGQEPNVEFLRRREDLATFRKTFRDALGQIVAGHDGIAEIRLLPAVPAPIAIACGQEVMPKAHPALAIYDNVRGTFQHAITINAE